MNEVTDRYNRMYKKKMEQVFTDLDQQDHETLSQLLDEFEQYKGAKHNDWWI